MKRACFVKEIMNINVKVTTKKTRRVVIQNELNKLSEIFEMISTKGLTKDFINNNSILNSAKYLSSYKLQII